MRYLAALAFGIMLSCSWLPIQDQPIWTDDSRLEGPRTPIAYDAYGVPLGTVMRAAELWNAAAGCEVFDLRKFGHQHEVAVVHGPRTGLRNWGPKLPLGGIQRDKVVYATVSAYLIDEQYREVAYLFGKVLGLADDPYGVMWPVYTRWIDSGWHARRPPRVRVNDGDRIALRERYCR